MAFLQETELERTIRRIVSCTHTLYGVAEELRDPDDVEGRADLVIAAENLLDAVVHVTERCRAIAWQNSPLPESDEDDYD